MSAFEKIEAVLPEFVKALDAYQVERYKAQKFGPHMVPPTHVLEQGKKYIRIVQCDQSSRSAYCFLDGDGNIYKSDGWKRPARGIRGNILTDENFSIGKGLTEYGAAYAR